MTRTAGRVLGVDLGSVRIGLALSDPLGITAQPLLVLPRSEARAEDHRAIVEIAREHEAVRIVVGLPRSLSGKLGPAAKAVLREVDELGAAAGSDLPVETYDERLTTVIAQQALAEAGVKGRNRKQHVDKVAAALILRDWLEGPGS